LDTTILILVIALIVAITLIQVLMFVRSKKSVGEAIPLDKIDVEIAENIRENSGLIYFYSPKCHNCKIQKPIIDKIKPDNYIILKVDVTQDLETARTLRIMGTPSLVFFEGNKIKGYYVGVKNESFILKKLRNKL